jgi:HNH endonuclease
METTIPRDLCQCGCGKKTTIAAQSSTRLGYIKGEPKPYVLGHNKLRQPPLAEAPLCACGCGQVLPLAKYRSHQAIYVHGHNPSAVLVRENIVKRFWARVRKTDACWEWTGSTRHFGHGHLNVSGRRVLAHRFSWELANGPIPPGLQINHHCDNPPCVRPDHLYLGTQADNTRDRVERGRSRGGRRPSARRSA